MYEHPIRLLPGLPEVVPLFFTGDKLLLDAQHHSNINLMERGTQQQVR